MILVHWYIPCILFILTATKYQMVFATNSQFTPEDLMIELYDTAGDNEILLKPTSMFKATSSTYGPRLPFGKKAAGPRSYSDLLQIKNESICDPGFPVHNTSFIALVDQVKIGVSNSICFLPNLGKRAQRLGAKHVIIYNTLEASRIDCDYSAQIPIDIVGNGSWPVHPDPSLCEERIDNFSKLCSSGLCKWNETTYKKKEVTACCVWDLHQKIGDETFVDLGISLSSMTIKETNRLFETLNQTGSAQALIYERWHPSFDVSSLLVCLLGVGVLWLSSYMSAKQYRDVRHILETENLDLSADDEPPLQNIETSTDESSAQNQSHVAIMGVETLSDEQEGDAHTSETARGVYDAGLNEDTAPTPLRRRERSLRELQAPFFIFAFQQRRARRSAALFAMGITFLLVIFFPNFEDVMNILFGIVGSVSLVNIVLYPILVALTNRFIGFNILVRPVCGSTERPYSIMWMDVVTIVAGSAICIFWLWVALTDENYRYNPYYWIIQDLMNISLCVVCLGVLQVKSIRVAVVILSIISMYLFLVLFSTLILGLKNMAWTGDEHIDIVKCQKNPNDLSCGQSQLPFLLAIPKINDYRGGISTLNLLSILLPGLLCSFAARYDATKYVLRSLNARERAARRGIEDISRLAPERSNLLRRIFSGYFYKLVATYATGMAVYLIALHQFHHSRESLIFVAPLLLLALYNHGNKRGDLPSLWHGPRRISIADLLVFRVHTEGAARIGVGSHALDEFSTAGTRSIMSSSESELEC